MNVSALSASGALYATMCNMILEIRLLAPFAYDNDDVVGIAYDIVVKMMMMMMMMMIMMTMVLMMLMTTQLFMIIIVALMTLYIYIYI